ncbi:hypothetical protein NP493_99g01041 [Ridgeia piscesae]|uniref:Uncharacterized protein n=1 Tax=Ridgeia piscesae TaxID=27915 RepID=A0AAD9P839_RIDPI|nr:hypothetical protein NP493_99g01041 [Ridgeia piscesae]
MHRTREVSLPARKALRHCSVTVVCGGLSISIRVWESFLATSSATIWASCLYTTTSPVEEFLSYKIGLNYSGITLSISM